MTSSNQVVSADEVREYTESMLNTSRKHKVNLSNIRENYREARMRERNGFVPLKGLEKVKDTINYNAHVTQAKKIMYANESIVLFVKFLFFFLL